MSSYLRQHNTLLWVLLLPLTAATTNSFLAHCSDGDARSPRKRKCASGWTSSLFPCRGGGFRRGRLQSIRENDEISVSFSYRSQSFHLLTLALSRMLNPRLIFDGIWLFDFVLRIPGRGTESKQTPISRLYQMG